MNEFLYLEVFGLLVLSIIIVKDVWCCFYLFFVLVDELWVSDDKNIVLINIIGKLMYCIKDVFNKWYCGLYIVVSDGELIYINKEYNIMKLFMIMKIKIKFIILKDFVLKFLSVYCFFFIGDIFVGVIKDNLRVGIVMYYNWYGEKMKDI